MTKFVNRFVISDTHFGHTNSWEKFKLEDGSPLRPFTSTEEMDETMIERWNAKVKPGDTVYHLGDVVINQKSLHLVSRLNGRKILIRGNHDIFKDKQYRDVGFEQLHGVRVFVDKFILSHIPLHPECVTGRFRVNVHGHLHANKLKILDPKLKRVVDLNTFEPLFESRETGEQFGLNEIPDYGYVADPRYLCVCVEQTDFTPLSFDEVESRIQKQWEDAGYTPPANDGWGNGSGPG
jgi:calcineurin-like phosphoesterase family protein